MKVIIQPEKPVSDAKMIELMFEIAKAFADLDIKGDEEINESDLPHLSQRIPRSPV